MGCFRIEAPSPHTHAAGDQIDNDQAGEDEDDFDKRDDTIATDVAVTDMRVVDFAFDSKTLRLIAEAEGRARVTVSKLSLQ